MPSPSAVILKKAVPQGYFTFQRPSQLSHTLAQSCVLGFRRPEHADSLWADRVIATDSEASHITGGEMYFSPQPLS